MWRTGIAVFLAVICVSEPALAQGARITGTVTSSDGTTPIVGAAVTIPGTRQGAITRDDGRYSIDVAAGTYRVKASRIGFAPEQAQQVGRREVCVSHERMICGLVDARKGVQKDFV